MPTAIIGGTGITKPDTPVLKTETVSTSYGNVVLARNDDLVFVNRHAPGHSVPPHNINSRAHIKALQQLGVKQVCGLFAVGLINPEYMLEEPILINDFLDQSSGRSHTFFDFLEDGKGHIDMTTPFCPSLCAAIEKQARKRKLNMQIGGTYVCTNGPRLESQAEIRAYEILGADYVGMTLCPELPLALEAGMSYAALAMPVNWATGVKDSLEISTTGVQARRKRILETVIAALGATKYTDCVPAKVY